MDKTASETERIRNKLVRELSAMYDATDEQILEAIEPYLNAMYLDDDTARANKRLRHARNNGLDELIDIFTAYILLANERAIAQINAAMNNVAGINYEHVHSSVEKKTGVDIGGTADAYKASKYSRRAYDRATQSKYVSDAVMDEIKKGVRAGESAKEIKRRIRKVADISRNSAKNTAVTETTRIRSESRLDAMKEARKNGVEMVKIWRHSPYVKEPREWHQNLEGAEMPLDEPFVVDGVEMQAPGDPNGGAKNNCYCRCFLDEEVISWR